METWLVTRCPSEKALTKSMRRRGKRPAIFLGSDSITMQTHDDTTIDITGSDKRGRQIKVFTYDAIEHIIGFLIGVVGAAFTQGTELLFTDVITQQRRVMSLDKELVLPVFNGKLCVHAIPAQQVFQLTGKSASVRKRF